MKNYKWILLMVMITSPVLVNAQSQKFGIELTSGIGIQNNIFGGSDEKFARTLEENTSNLFKKNVDVRAFTNVNRRFSIELGLGVSFMEGKLEYFYFENEYFYYNYANRRYMNNMKKINFNVGLRYDVYSDTKLGNLEILLGLNHVSYHIGNSIFFDFPLINNQVIVLQDDSIFGYYFGVRYAYKINSKWSVILRPEIHASFRGEYYTKIPSFFSSTILAEEVNSIPFSYNISIGLAKTLATY